MARAHFERKIIMSDISSIGGFNTSYLDTLSTMSKDANRAEKTADAVKGVNSDMTKEELEKAAKSFESYFVEQILKEMKQSVDNINGPTNSTAEKYTEYFMDSTIQTLAEEIVDKYGQQFTDTMVEQMARNYNIDAKEQ